MFDFLSSLGWQWLSLRFFWGVAGTVTIYSLWRTNAMFLSRFDHRGTLSQQERLLAKLMLFSVATQTSWLALCLMMIILQEL